MGFSLLDYAIVALYLVGVTLAGASIARNQKNPFDYFLGGKELPWWAVGLSIVASETSTLTFISVPGLAYAGTMHFLQLAVGYFIGRLIVAFLFIPVYYAGNLETAYDYLGRRFGTPLRKFASFVFIVTRLLGSAVRLFATAIHVHLITGLQYGQSIMIVGVFTLVYTYLGGRGLLSRWMFCKCSFILAVPLLRWLLFWVIYPEDVQTLFRWQSPTGQTNWRSSTQRGVTGCCHIWRPRMHSSAASLAGRF